MSATIPLPYMLDFYPLEDEKFTRIHQFFTNLKAGKFTTTRCKKCSTILWQPRVVCSECLSTELEWIELPKEGELFAYTAMVLGAPLGMEKEVPFVIGIVKLDGIDLKILSRIDDVKYEDCEIGMRVELKVIRLEDERVFYRFKPK
ncbi:MAG: Zn-ribbon domain-containing OB-fold protein [Candidatus Thermoplasmatota archaeon]|nr:Zn-ribbon domain-containing OB-fold protein [Candidatus Thermoplasmatota archaeon]